MGAAWKGWGEIRLSCRKQSAFRVWLPFRGAAHPTEETGKGRRGSLRLNKRNWEF